MSRAMMRTKNIGSRQTLFLQDKPDETKRGGHGPPTQLDCSAMNDLIMDTCRHQGQNVLSVCVCMRLPFPPSYYMGCVPSYVQGRPNELGLGGRHCWDQVDECKVKSGDGSLWLILYKLQTILHWSGNWWCGSEQVVHEPCTPSPAWGQR